MLHIEVLKNLRTKLNGSNSRSIHLNVLPGRFACRLGLENLNLVELGLSKKFLQLILGKSSFDLQLVVDSGNKKKDNTELRLTETVVRRIKAIHFENEDNYKEYGIKTFGFGFPLIVKQSQKDPQKAIIAPIFIWSLELLKDNQKANTWIVTRNKTRNEKGKLESSEIHSIGLNEVLLAYLNTDLGISFPPIPDNLLEDGIIDKTELVAECHRLLTAISTQPNTNQEQYLYNRLEKVLESDPESIQGITAGMEPQLVFNGVFGLFRTPKESIIKDYDRLVENTVSLLPTDDDIGALQYNRYNPIKLDPSQQAVINTLSTNSKIIIQGPPGTGKSQTLTAILAHALANKKKCLVVCEKKTALNVIKANLHRLHPTIADLAVVIDDVSKDRDPIVRFVREKTNHLNAPPPFHVDNHGESARMADEKLAIINHQHGTLSKSIYRNLTWGDLVGICVEHQETVAYSILDALLDYKDYAFDADEDELSRLLAKYGKATMLLKEVNGIDHPLSFLKNDVFNRDIASESKLKIEKYLKEHAQPTTELLEKLQLAYSEYESALHRHFNEYYSSLKNAVQASLDFAAKCAETHGQLFLQNNWFSTNLVSFLAVFSVKYKQHKLAKTKLLQDFVTIKTNYQKLSYFSHDFIDNENFNSINELTNNLVELKQKTEIWYSKITDIIRHYLANMSSHYLNVCHKDNMSSLQKTERQVEDLISKHKTHDLFLLENDSTEIFQKKISYLKLLRAKIDTIKSHLNEFREYYDWRHFDNNLSWLEKKTINALLKLNAETAEKTFETWYYFWLLNALEKKHPYLPKNDEKLQEALSITESIKKRQIELIANIWQTQLIKSEKLFKEKHESIHLLYNLKGRAGQRRNTLRTIIRSHHDFFTDVFPIVMVNPVVCSSVIPMVTGLFDIVIFDEASQLRIEDTYPALLKGKVKVISGDSQQMPPSHYFQGSSLLLDNRDENPEEETDVSKFESSLQSTARRDLSNSNSLLHFAEMQNYAPYYLSIHYRSKHPYLIDFSNAAFYGQRLLPMPATNNYVPIKLIEVAGIYGDQTNPDEAKQVIKILRDEIRLTAEGKYPSVGVATFNLYQRNLIIDEIGLAQNEFPDFKEKMAVLEPDFFVKNLENIQGDERDILIISTTFGPKADGSFRQNYGPISQSDGYKLLNVIITRAKLQLYICTSIPSVYYLTPASIFSKSISYGTKIFYSYLAYVRMVTSNDNLSRQLLLTEVLENSEISKTTQAEPFNNQNFRFKNLVYDLICQTIGKENLHTDFLLGGFVIDIMVTHPLSKKPLLAIECDGSKHHNCEDVCVWDLFRQSVMEEYGISFHRIWSVNWYHSKEKEFIKLIELIETHIIHLNTT